MANIIVYEKLEDFLSKLKELGENTTVYLSTMYQAKNDGLTYVVIRQYFHDGLGIFHMYDGGRDIKPIRGLNDSYFDMMPTPEAKDDALNDYRAIVDDFNLRIKTEYNKAKEMVLKLVKKTVEAELK